MSAAVTALPAALDQTSGRPVGIGFGFFLIVLVMVALFAIIVWVGKMRDRHRAPRHALQLPLLVKADEERERRRNNRR